MDKKKLLIIIGSIIVIIVVLFIFFLMNNKKSIDYNILFETNGGSLVDSQTVNEGGKVKKPIDPTKEGYIFVEWTYQGKSYNFNLEVTSDLTLIAKWIEVKENIETYLIKFDTDGGTIISNQIIEKGNKVQIPVVPTKEGYIFKGWFLNGENYDFETIVKENLELKAKWEKIKVTNNNQTNNNINSSNKNNNNNINNKPTTSTNPTTTSKKYKVTFNSNGGSPVSFQSINEGSKVSKPVNPTRSGYTFGGWILNKSIFNFNTKITKEIELVALWIKIPKIKYKEINNDSEKVTYDISIDYQSYREEDKNTISGWELYVTSDNAEGNEIFIDGVGYFLHSTNGNETIRPADVDYGDTNRYIARVYKDTDNGRIYSDWSNIIEINPN